MNEELKKDMLDAGSFLVDGINAIEDKEERKKFLMGHILITLDLIKIELEEKIKILKEIIERLEEKKTKLNYIG
jgi:uncharacterized small protein (DUF1192 family)